MTRVDLPAPAIRAEPWRGAALAAALASRVDGEVRFDDGSRAAYATDASNFRQVPIASNFRQVPIGVVVPRSVEAAVEAVAVCRQPGSRVRED